MITTSTESSLQSEKTTVARTGGPPRWLVVGLVLAVGVGMWTQGMPQGRVRVAPPAIHALDVDLIIPLASRPPLPGAILPFQHALAHDPSTDRFWLAVRCETLNQTRLDIHACVDGGKSLLPPVDVQPLLPTMNDTTAAITCAPDGTLYLAFNGTDPKRGPQLGILRSTDAGATWSHWWGRVDNGARIDDQAFQLVPWNDKIVLLYWATKSEAPSGYFVEILSPDGTATSPLLISQKLPDDFPTLQEVLTTSEAMHLLVQTGDYVPRTRLWTCGLSRTNEPLPSQKLHVQKGHKLVGATMLQDASGLPIVLMKLDTPIPGIIKLFSKAHAHTNVSDPRTPTLRYEWDAQQRQWQACPEQPGPATFVDMRSPAPGWVVSGLVRNNSTDRGLFIDALAADGTWSDRWELMAPADTWYSIAEGVQLTDGRLVLLGFESLQPSFQHRDMLLITDTLPELDASKAREAGESTTP